MLVNIAGAPVSRLVVVAYDIAAPQRARAARRVLDAVNHAKQFSVYEALLRRGEVRRVLTEMTACCDLAVDRLAVWWPLDGLRLVWRADCLQVEAQAGGVCSGSVGLPANVGNFMVCYDISEAAALRAVAALVAAETAMIQRSVYWLRAPRGRLLRLLEQCAPYLDTHDRLWVYPLSSSDALWRIGEAAAVSLIPMNTHHW